jgi:hypothetical protein
MKELPIRYTVGIGPLEESTIFSITKKIKPVLFLQN